MKRENNRKREAALMHFSDMERVKMLSCCTTTHTQIHMDTHTSSHTHQLTRTPAHTHTSKLDLSGVKQLHVQRQRNRERYAGREVERQKRDRDGKTARENDIRALKDL